MVKLVGILNITPDSFSDGGSYSDVAAALQHAEQLFSDGADFIDVGAEATNPKAEPIHHQEEWARLEAILPELIKKYPGKISLDTRHPETAKRFLELGGTILNDVSGFRLTSMITLAAQFQPLCIINHFPGADSKQVHRQHIDSLDEVTAELLQKRDELIAAGIPAEKIVLDPGIGFGKTMELNQELLEFAREVPNIPVMIGHSRKRFLGENRMSPEVNVQAAQKAVQAGATYLRVHDVLAHKTLINNQN